MMNLIVLFLAVFFMVQSTSEAHLDITLPYRFRGLVGEGRPFSKKEDVRAPERRAQYHSLEDELLSPRLGFGANSVLSPRFGFFLEQPSWK
ncbi:hypothetical protein NECAME_09733 [Necator americanus]|uniref:Uncharacterized protein n=1 Tax=Necator americanus TaxID=51031 RepID=W2TCL8_NECAM|nr:hypothetical protein NECAME_09733 [Necator americanus]ETN79593.1 hypothetical protein NECAME_09733 [Necator americanus]